MSNKIHMIIKKKLSEDDIVGMISFNNYGGTISALQEAKSFIDWLEQYGLDKNISKRKLKDVISKYVKCANKERGNVFDTSFDVKYIQGVVESECTIAIGVKDRLICNTIWSVFDSYKDFFDAMNGVKKEYIPKEDEIVRLDFDFEDEYDFSNLNTIIESLFEGEIFKCRNDDTSVYFPY